MRYAAVLLLLALAGCAGGGDTEPTPAPTPASPSSSSGSPSSGPSSSPSRGTAQGPVDSTACEQVRAGIAAFNEGDYEETVARFVEAVPLAEKRLDGSAAADELLEAVRWYAALPPEDYPAASQDSADFERYKQITLSQCMPVGGEPAPSSSDPGLEA